MSDDLQQMAQRLFDAEQRGRPLDVLDDGGALPLDRAYGVQKARNRLMQATGAFAVGWKIGLTSPGAQAAFGATEPMCGLLFRHTRLTTDAQVDLAGLCAPRLEGEILLQVGAPVSPDADDATLLASLASVHAAFEIADSRMKDWRMGVGDAVADNACCARFGFVEPGASPEAVDLRNVGMTITDQSDGSVASNGRGEACLGSPLNAYRWLLQRLAAHGDSLKPGQFVLTGALGPMVPMSPDRSYRIELSGLGVMTVATTRSR